MLPTINALILWLAEDNAFGLTQYDGFTSFFGGNPVMSEVQSQSVLGAQCTTQQRGLAQSPLRLYPTNQYQILLDATSSSRNSVPAKGSNLQP
jgi:hypothetical protein